MSFWVEWVIAVHRAVWFPLNWAVGLEAKSVAVPMEFAPALVSAQRLRLVKSARGPAAARTAPASRRAKAR